MKIRRNIIISIIVEIMFCSFSNQVIPDPNSLPKIVEIQYHTKISIDDTPGGPTKLTVAEGDLELSVALEPEELFGLATRLVNAASRHAG